MKKIFLGLILVTSLAKADIIWTLDSTLREIIDIKTMTLEVSNDKEYFELLSELQSSIYIYAKNNNLNINEANNLFSKEVQNSGSIAGQNAMFELMTGEESVNVNLHMKNAITKLINFYNE